MKLIRGLIKPTLGSISIWGCDIGSDTIAAQKHIGYLPEGTPSYDEMTPRSFLGFIAEVRGFGKQERTQRVDSVFRAMSRQKVLVQRILNLSKGFKRRVGLAQAIIHDPDVLILDEPTDGLDPNQKHQVREMIRGLSKEKIVIISTHILEEVTAVCTRAIIISNGSIVSDCTPAVLQEKSRFHEAVTLKFKSVDEAKSAASKLGGSELVSSVEEKEAELLVFPERKDGSLLPLVTDLVRSEGWQLAGLFQERGRLDEVFRTITTENSHVGH
jgi:ABC-2 type transport system ATP-binding protein